MVFCSSNPKEAFESPLKVSKSTFVRVHYSLIISLIFQDFFFYLAHLRLIVKLTSAVSKLKKKTKKKKTRENCTLCIVVWHSMSFSWFWCHAKWAAKWMSLDAYSQGFERLLRSGASCQKHSFFQAQLILCGYFSD